jgi:hypothetical protein
MPSLAPWRAKLPRRKLSHRTCQTSSVLLLGQKPHLRLPPCYLDRRLDIKLPNLTQAQGYSDGSTNRPRPCWAPNGMRPRSGLPTWRMRLLVWRRHPRMDCVYLIMPAPDTKCFRIFRETLADKYPRHLILLFMDGAVITVLDGSNSPRARSAKRHARASRPQRCCCGPLGPSLALEKSMIFLGAA